ncbi:NADPH-dependent F420 reductase [Flavobacterium sp. FlaQc-57]|uniref:NADPH-dependent F420 reductase n=1 Tax=Flavobacterium sp. FlaQc-57 TaxID=3374186 RepID=UPI003756DF55
MKIGILGTGQVGNLIGSRLIENGHQVMIGGREANNERGLAFLKNNSENASYGTFEEASFFGEIIFNATNGRFALDALKLCNTDFEGKIIIDVANPLDFSTKPPTLIPEFANTNSIGESIQNLFPKAKVIKTLNTLGMALAVNPKQLNDGDHSVFVAGNDENAKIKTKTLLTEFGWNVENLNDIGDITASRAMESYLILMIRLSMSLNVPMLNIKVIK